MKLLVFLLIFNLFFSFVSAQSSFLEPRLPPDINCGTDFFECAAFFFIRILRIVLVLALVLATLFIVWAGFLYITQSEKIENIHKRLRWAVIGLIVAFLAYAFVLILENALSSGNVYLSPNIVLAQVKEPQPPVKEPQPPVKEPQPPSGLKCGSITLPSVLESTDVSSDLWKICIFFYLSKILTLLYILALALGVIFLAWAGILYITNPEKSKDIHSRLIWGIAGILLAILSFTLVKLIDLFFTKP